MYYGENFLSSFLDSTNMGYFNRHELIINWLEKDDRGLDIGCAEGISTNFLLKKCKEIYGIDPSNELIQKARKDYPHINFKIGCAEKIPFKDQMFDAVVMSDVLEHVENEEKSLEEIYRVLKPNGKFLLTAPHKGLFSFMDVDNYSWYYRKLLKIKTDKIGYQNKHRHYSLEDLEKLFENKFYLLNVYRSSLILLPLILNFRLLIRKIFGEKVEIKMKPYLKTLMDLDFSIRFGKFSFYVGVCAKKI